MGVFIREGPFNPKFSVTGRVFLPENGRLLDHLRYSRIPNERNSVQVISLLK